MAPHGLVILYKRIKSPSSSSSVEDMVGHLERELRKAFSGKETSGKELEGLFEHQSLVERMINRKCVEHYNGKHPKHHLWTTHYQFVIDNVSKGDKVFDIGTGASVSYTQELAGKCKSVDCCDIRDELVARSEQENRFDNVRYQVLDITRELPEGEYDVVILSHILEHLDDPVGVLESIKRITKKIIVRLPRYDDHWMYLVKKDLGLFYYKDRDHRREYTLQEAVDLTQSAGWRVEAALNDVDIKIVARI